MKSDLNESSSAFEAKRAYQLGALCVACAFSPHCVNRAWKVWNFDDQQKFDPEKSFGQARRLEVNLTIGYLRAVDRCITPPDRRCIRLVICMAAIVKEKQSTENEIKQLKVVM